MAPKARARREAPARRKRPEAGGGDRWGTGGRRSGPILDGTCFRKAGDHLRRCGEPYESLVLYLRVATVRLAMGSART